jgi:transposase
LTTSATVARAMAWWRPVEGHVNRLKMLKRQMFGRANLDLLRRRVLATT